MKNTKLVLAAILLAALPCQAEPFWKNKLWWAGEAVNIAMPLLDANSTEYSAHRGGIETHPWLIGRHPSAHAAYEQAAGAVVFYTGLHIISWKLSHKDQSGFWRNVGRWGVPASVTANHLPAAIHNYRLEHPSYRAD